MIIAITGGRDYHPTGTDFVWLGETMGIISKHVKLAGSTILHGGAAGVDAEVSQMLSQYGFRLEEHKPDYEKYPGHFAPLQRNAEMARKCDVLLAFPGGAGTANMVEQCRRLGVPVHESPSRIWAIQQLKNDEDEKQKA